MTGKVGDAYEIPIALGERPPENNDRKACKQMTAYEMIMIVIAIISLLRQKKD